MSIDKLTNLLRDIAEGKTKAEVEFSEEKGLNRFIKLKSEDGTIIEFNTYTNNDIGVKSIKVNGEEILRYEYDFLDGEKKEIINKHCISVNRVIYLISLIIRAYNRYGGNN